MVLSLDLLVCPHLFHVCWLSYVINRVFRRAVISALIEDLALFLIPLSKFVIYTHIYYASYCPDFLPPVRVMQMNIANVTLK